MTCKEFEKNIPNFIKRKLDFFTLQEFCEHMEDCENCGEELVIQFLVAEGMQRLEDGDAFDLQRELDARAAEAERKIRFHGAFLQVGLVLELLAVFGIAGAVVWILL